METIEVIEVTEQRLKNVFSEVLGIPPSEINDEIAYDKSKGWDSLAHMALIAALDSQFDIMLDTDDVVDLSSYGKSKEILRKYGVQV
jgi:acyl carrier protein